MSHERHGFPDHRLFECLLNNSFRLRSEKHQLWPFVRGNHPWPVDSPHKGPVTRKKFPFHDVFMLCFFFVAKWFCKDLILQPMKDHSRKTHNDYVTKLTRSVDKYPGNPFATLRAHPSHPAGGTQLFCTYGVIALRKRPRREQRKQRVADLLSSIEHCLFNGSNVICILCDITHTPLWRSQQYGMVD